MSQTLLEMAKDLVLTQIQAQRLSPGDALSRLRVLRIGIIDHEKP